MKKKKKFKIKKNSGKKISKKTDDSFAIFVKVYVYGIILLNLPPMFVAFLFSQFYFVYGQLLGMAASYFYLWSMAEQRKKYLQLFKTGQSHKKHKGFMVRYMVMIVFLAMSGIISLNSLFGTFYSLFMIRIVIYIIAFMERKK